MSTSGACRISGAVTTPPGTDSLSLSAKTRPSLISLISKASPENPPASTSEADGTTTSSLGAAELTGMIPSPESSSGLCESSLRRSTLPNITLSWFSSSSRCSLRVSSMSASISGLDTPIFRSTAPAKGSVSSTESSGSTGAMATTLSNMPSSRDLCWAFLARMMMGMVGYSLRMRMTALLVADMSSRVSTQALASSTWKPFSSSGRSMSP
mmetsp:Transcript_9369/g.20558  ORF Transcript_9369/g.20558 Transcript_9369/m.20558 type:complete len:211 (-) Transcript_9369:1504-2136(-)